MHPKFEKIFGENKGKTQVILGKEIAFKNPDSDSI
jgi:hypothetical protein